MRKSLNLKSLNRFMNYLRESNNPQWQDCIKKDIDIKYYSGVFDDDMGVTLVGYLQNGQAVLLLSFTWRDELNLNYIQDLLFHTEQRVDDFNE